MKFTFTTKTEYIAQVAEYKTEYEAISKKLRGLKQEIKIGMRAGTPVYAQQWEAIRTVKEANALIDARIVSKVEAQKQYAAMKTA